MHELSLALEVCRIAQARLEGAGPVVVRAVGVDVGREAGVELSNFQFCLEGLFQEPPFSGAQPLLTEQPGSELRVSYVEIDDGH